MSDPTAPRSDDQRPGGDASTGGEPPRSTSQPAEPLDGFAVTDEQHAAPSTPEAPSLGEPARPFSAPSAESFSAAAAGGAAGEPAPGTMPAHDAQPFAGSPSAGHAGAPQHGSDAPHAGQPGGAAWQAPGPAAPHGAHVPGGTPAGAPNYGQPQGAPQAAPGGFGTPPYSGPTQPPGGYQGQYGAPGQPQYAQHAPMSPLEEKNAGMWAHLSGLSTIVTGGMGGWIGPLIVFLMYKDRSPFARQEARESLNFGLLMTLIALGLLIVGTLTSFFGIGILIAGLYWVPGLLQAIFSIVGAMRVNNGGSYRYPFNWHVVK